MCGLRDVRLGYWALHSSGFPAPSYGGQVKCPVNRTQQPHSQSRPPPSFAPRTHTTGLSWWHTHLARAATVFGCLCTRATRYEQIGSVFRLAGLLWLLFAPGGTCDMGPCGHGVLTLHTGWVLTLLDRLVCKRVSVEFVGVGVVEVVARSLMLVFVGCRCRCCWCNCCCSFLWVSLLCCL